MNNPYQHLKEYEGVSFVYKDEFCPLLDLEIKTSGKAKQLQLNGLKQYMELDTSNRKIKIVKIYDENEIKLIEQHGKFTSYIENILIDYLIKNNSKDYDVRLTYREIFESIGILNKKYYEVLRPNKPTDIGKHRYIEIVANDMKIKEKTVSCNLNLFFEYTESLLKRMIKDSLKSMEKRKLIIVSKSFRLYRKTVSPINGKEYVESKDCTDEETSIILKIYRDVMNDFGIQKINEIFYKEHENELNLFFKDINNRIFERFNYEVHSPTFKLILADGAFDVEYEPSLNMMKLNQNVQRKLYFAKSIDKEVVDAQKERFIEDLIALSGNLINFENEKLEKLK